MRKDEEIKIRVPGSIKLAFKQLAEARFTSESELTREALLMYLSSRGITADQLRDAPVTDAAKAAHDKAVVKIVKSYGPIGKKGPK